MADLVVIVPSRGRPELATALVQHFKQTCTANTRLTFAVDADDPTLSRYPYELTAPVPQPSTMVRALNFAATGVAGLRAATETEVSWMDGTPFAVGFMGDDHMPRTYGWDERYLAALRELGTGIVYGNDLFQGHRLPTQVAMTTDIVRAVGYMALPALTHLFVDNLWLRWGRSLDRIRYLPDVVVEHRHPVAGKAQWDDNYARVNSGEVAAHDEAVFNAYVAGGLEADLAKIRAVMAVDA